MKKLLNTILILITASSLHAQEALPKLKPLKEKNLIGTLIPVEKKGKWGYGIVAEDGKKPKVVVKEFFGEAHEFVDSVAIVKYNGKYGLLHRTGVFAMEPDYDEFNDFSSGVALARKNNTYFKINTECKQICKWGTLTNGTHFFVYNDITFNLKSIAPGKFEMGGKAGYPELEYDSPEHEVNITKTFYIGESEVTQALWTAVMDSNPSKSLGNLKPVENITWDDCHIFMKRLGEIFNTEFRLPTEAEWEFAARGGSNTSVFSGGNDDNNVCWHVNNCKATQEVMKKAANGYGLYDMSGNVAEWCSDWYNSFYYKECPYNDPTGATFGKGRVVRGGDWKSLNLYARVFCRMSHAPKYKGGTVGMRLAQ